MTNDRQIERLLDAWFADGPLSVHDRVIDDVAARITRQPQRPAWRLPSWRFPTMSTPVKLVLIGAALVAALAAGAVLVGGGARFGQPTPAPVASPMTLKDGPAVPGTYLVRPYPDSSLSWTVTVPDGWSAFQGFALIGPELPGNHGTALTLGEKMGVPADPCTVEGTPNAATVDEFIMAIQAREDLMVSEPVDITVGGHSGRRIDVELPAAVDSCGTNQDYWVTSEDGTKGWYAQAASNRFTFWVLDVEGTPAVLLRSTFADAPAEEITETDAMVASSVIGR